MSSLNDKKDESHVGPEKQKTLRGILSVMGQVPLWNSEYFELFIKNTSKYLQLDGIGEIGKLLHDDMGYAAILSKVKTKKQQKKRDLLKSIFQNQKVIDTFNALISIVQKPENILGKKNKVEISLTDNNDSGKPKKKIQKVDKDVKYLTLSIQIKPEIILKGKMIRVAMLFKREELANIGIKCQSFKEVSGIAKKKSYLRYGLGNERLIIDGSNVLFDLDSRLKKKIYLVNVSILGCLALELKDKKVKNGKRMDVKWGKLADVCQSIVKHPDIGDELDGNKLELTLKDNLGNIVPFATPIFISKK